MELRLIRATRRSFLRAATLVAPSFVASDLASGAPNVSPEIQPSPKPYRDGQVSHALAMHGAPALSADFQYLPYVNPDAPKGGRLNLAFVGTFDSLNPFNLKSGSSAQGINGNIFQSMMARSLDEPFTLYGLLAESVETNAERDYVVFRLDRRAKFSDGGALTADDVLFSFDLLKRLGRPQHRFSYSLVKSAAALDPHTILFDLTGTNDRELPLILGLMPILSKAHINEAQFSDSSLAIPIGSGPYSIQSVKPGEQITLRRNRDYWGRDVRTSRGMANFDEIHIYYYRDANTMFESFKAGLIDYREEDNPTRWRNGYNFPAVRDQRVVCEQLPIGAPRGTEGFAFNTRRPLFQDVRIREALSIMFDFEWINHNLYADLYTRTSSFFDNSELSSVGRPASEAERALLAPFPNVVRPDILAGTWTPFKSDGSGRDREQARRAIQLLQESGWRLQSGVLTKDGQQLSFEIMVVDRTQERLALLLSNSLERVGVRARVRSVDEVQYQRRRQKFDFDMMMGTWAASASPGAEQRNRWSSASADQESSFNIAGARSPVLDALIQNMLAAKTREDFIVAVRAYDRVLLSGFYVIPLFHSRVQWSAHWRRIARPLTLPRWAAPLFSSTLDVWWSEPP